MEISDPFGNRLRFSEAAKSDVTANPQQTKVELAQGNPAKISRPFRRTGGFPSKNCGAVSFFNFLRRARSSMVVMDLSNEARAPKSKSSL